MPTVSKNSFQPVLSLFEPLHDRQLPIATPEMVESCLKKPQIKTNKAYKSENSPGVTKTTSQASAKPCPWLQGQVLRGVGQTLQDPPALLGSHLALIPGLHRAT